MLEGGELSARERAGKGDWKNQRQSWEAVPKWGGSGKTSWREVTSEQRGRRQGREPCRDLGVGERPGQRLWVAVCLLSVKDCSSEAKQLKQRE